MGWKKRIYCRSKQANGLICLNWICKKHMDENQFVLKTFKCFWCRQYAKVQYTNNNKYLPTPYLTKKTTFAGGLWNPIQITQDLLSRPTTIEKKMKNVVLNPLFNEKKNS